MDTLNLIPPQIKLAEKNKKLFSVLSTTLILLIVMASITFGALFAINYFTNNEIAQVNQSLAEEKAKLKNLEQIENDVIAINSKLEKITTLQKDRILWSSILADLNHDTPEQVVIDTFTTGATDLKVTINGSAETLRDIVKLQVKLGTSSHFSNLIFNNSNYSESEGMYSFTMNGELKK